MSSPSSVSDYDRLIHKTGTFDSIMTANPALYVSMRNQFVPSMSYTITYASAANHRNPVWLQFSIKEAGNVTSGIYAAAGKRNSASKTRTSSEVPCPICESHR